MPSVSFDGYMYSYLVKQNVQNFKRTPGLPVEYVDMSDGAYTQQAPYYVVKPLFNWAVRGAAPVAGVLYAPYLVSACAYFGLGWAVWLWLGALGVEGAWHTVGAILISFNSVATDTARHGTPDTLCAAITVLGCWLLFSTPKPLLGASVLTLAILSRPDAIILNGLLLLAAMGSEKLSKTRFVIFAGIMFAAYFFASHGGYGYRQTLAWGIRTSYLQAFFHDLLKTEMAIYAPFALIGLFAFRLKYHSKLLLGVVFSLIIRYIAMPTFVVRYLLPSAMVVAVVGCAGVLTAVDRPNRSFDPRECSEATA